MIKYSDVRSTKNQYVAGCFAVMAGMLLFACPVQAAESGIEGLRLNAGVASALDLSNEFGEIDTTVTKSMTALFASKAVGSVSDVLSEANLWGYTNLGMAHVDNNLNIRETAEENGKMVGKLPKDAACEINYIEGNWANITSGKVTGFVSLDYLYTGKEAIAKAKEVVSLLAKVETETLYVREEPNTECAIITMVPLGEELEVEEQLENGWVKILIDDEPAYVSGDYVDVQERLGTAITMTELLYGAGVSDVRIDLCQYAKQFVGNPYKWGGISLTNGADCSGFVLSVFKKYGIDLPHHAATQAGYGTKITLAEAQPGDLIFYAKNGKINHVAIYIGNGQVVHASSPKTGIKISNSTYRTPAKVVRILK